MHHHRCFLRPTHRLGERTDQTRALKQQKKSICLSSLTDEKGECVFLVFGDLDGERDGAQTHSSAHTGVGLMNILSAFAQSGTT